MRQYLMQARSSSNGQLVVWSTLADTPDFAGASFPGPGTPVDPAIVTQTEDFGTTFWTVSSVTMQTTNEDFGVGTGGSAHKKVRQVGGDLQLEFEVSFGTSPAAGTGNLVFPIGASIDFAQMLVGGTAIPYELAKDGLGGTQEGQMVDAQTMWSADMATITTMIGAPANGKKWVFTFSLPLGLT